MSFLTSSKLNSMKKSFRQGDYAKALSYADKLTLADVHTSYDLSMMADVYMENGLVDEAIKVYAELYTRNKSTRLCKQLIDLSIELDDIEQAIGYLGELKELDPDDYERYVFQYRIGKILGESDEYLLNNLKKVREADYIDVWAYELAKLYFKLGMNEECVKESKNVILWFPETRYAHKAQLLISACESGKTYEELLPVRNNFEFSEEDDDSDENGNVIFPEENEDEAGNIEEALNAETAEDEAADGEGGEEAGEDAPAEAEESEAEAPEDEEEPEDDYLLAEEERKPVDVSEAVDNLTEEETERPVDVSEAVHSLTEEEQADRPDVSEAVDSLSEEPEEEDVFPEDSFEDELPKITLPDPDEVDAETMATSVPGDKTLINDTLADEVIRALRAQDEDNSEEAADAVDASIMRLLAEEDRK